jgi:restriction system protein
MKRLWKVSLGRNGEYEAAALEQNMLTIGFGMTEDISHAKDRDSIGEILQRAFPDAKPKTLLNFAAQVNQFINVMQIGDLVICPIKTTSTIAIARIADHYKPHPETGSPTRTVEWLKADLPRDSFKQDLLFSFGAFNTVCEVSRNDAFRRVEAVVVSGIDPGDGTAPAVKSKGPSRATADESLNTSDESPVDLDRIARDQIERRIASVFTGHGLANLVGEILKAKGMMVRVSPPGADGGVDLVAGSGELGLESPRIVVQVKSGKEIVDQPQLQGLIGTVQDTTADFGLCVSWGGFTSVVRRRTNELFFRVRFWGRNELIDNLLEVYEDLPEAIRAELPLRRTWTLVTEEGEEP